MTRKINENLSFLNMILNIEIKTIAKTKGISNIDVDDNVNVFYSFGEALLIVLMPRMRTRQLLLCKTQLSMQQKSLLVLTLNTSLSHN